MQRERGVVTIPRYGILQEADTIAQRAWEGHRRELLAAPTGLAYHGTHIGPDFVIEPDGSLRERKYDAFVQLLIKKENKIAAVSFPLPLGVTPEMGQEVLRRTLYPQEEYAPARSFGEKRELRAMVRMGIPDNLLGRFIAAAEDVIDEQHPKKNHKAVRKFYRDQLIRKYYLPHVQQDVDEILENEVFLRKSAWRDENRGKRIFVMEHYVDPQTGKLLGVGPAPQYKVYEVAQLGASEGHREWLSFYEAFATMEGDGVLGHVDGGNTVDMCGGSKRCSVFFDEMEADPSEKVFDLATGMAVDRMIDPQLLALRRKNEEEEEMCDECEKKKRECKGHKKDAPFSGNRAAV